jgi:hypothetical protein
MIMYLVFHKKQGKFDSRAKRKKFFLSMSQPESMQCEDNELLNIREHLECALLRSKYYEEQLKSICESNDQSTESSIRQIIAYFLRHMDNVSDSSGVNIRSLARFVSVDEMGKCTPLSSAHDFDLQNLILQRETSIHLNIGNQIAIATWDKKYNLDDGIPRICAKDTDGNRYVIRQTRNLRKMDDLKHPLKFTAQLSLPNVASHYDRVVHISNDKQLTSLVCKFFRLSEWESNRCSAMLTVDFRSFIKWKTELDGMLFPTLGLSICGDVEKTIMVRAEEGNKTQEMCIGMCHLSL